MKFILTAFLVLGSVTARAGEWNGSGSGSDVDGSTPSLGGLEVNGPSVFKGSITATSIDATTATTHALYVKNDLTVNSTSTFVSTVGINGMIGVNGSATFYSSVTVRAAATITGVVTMGAQGNTVDANGTFTAFPAAGTRGYQTSAGYYNTQTTGRRAYNMSSAGSNQGGLDQIASDLWGLGYGASETALGEDSLSWDASGNVMLGQDATKSTFSTTGALTMASSAALTTNGQVNINLMSATDYGIVVSSQNGASKIFAVDKFSHFSSSAATNITLGTCVNGAIRQPSNDRAGWIDFTGANTSCAIVFANPYPDQGNLICADSTKMATPAAMATTVTKTGITFVATAFANGDSLNYICEFVGN